MARQYVDALCDGDNVEETYLLVDKQLRANRNANTYLLATLRDSTGQISGLMWNVVEESIDDIQAGSFVRVRGKVQLYQGGLQMILTHIRLDSSNEVDPADFFPATDKNVDQLLKKLRDVLLSIEDVAIRTLMECFLADADLMDKLSRAPAGIKAHHAYHGGLLEHVTNILQTAHRIGDLYPTLNLDILLAGIFLHDLGKIRELEYESHFSYTDEGQLLGHMIIAIEILTQKIEEASKVLGEPFPEEATIHLKHLIASHHGIYEHGSPKLPMTPEAIALHHLDNLDAKVNEFSRMISDDPDGQSNWTPYNPRIERKLFKGIPS